MNIKQPNEDQAASWEYLPNINDLLEYLDREDLMELSKCWKSYKLEKMLEFLKADLGSKLKFIKKFMLDNMVGCEFAEKLIKLLRNIKTLSIFGYVGACSLGKGLTTILKGLEHLEHVDFYCIDDKIDDYSTKKQIFPKSIKSLKISYYGSSNYYNNEYLIYDTIDASYINLYSLTIVSNRMLQNLSLGMINLQEVEIIDFRLMDQSILLKFLKANPQIRKLNTNLSCYNEEVIKTVLSSKYIEYWCIDGIHWKGIEFNNLQPNYSIKFLEIGDMPPPLILKIVNACKGLETIDFEPCRNIDPIEWSKFERRINNLKLHDNNHLPRYFNEIDHSKQFNQVHIEYYQSIEKFKEDYNVDKLKNYKFVPLISRSCILKLVNKTD
ncbi:hypothetical protein CONCODRAFT_8443 [Conidiobolus coronatus NRRL 28638]|uniref:RNI-like protein n=1 Tax=Conidiobolus coronatus (strain ATCC 28846 / CBS 209.66 / NRRL 28638) TaxID=796925 RepID=A0A137P280_CONC2|nr:hypothetical protein CONCODRAFT_8443 [Conidiobolus coronatus NRRL 28638]|eukprot:KXN69155.1 hypothetical protein CONCODRAFT_8443 [Conidiobolus coronatus NRRL 28638]